MEAAKTTLTFIPPLSWLIWVCDVRHAQPSGFPDAPLSWLLLSNQHLNGGGLTCAVGTNHSDSADLGHCQADIHDGGLVFGGVLEGYAVHAQDHLAAALHTFHGTRLWKHELHRFVAQLKVSFLLWVLLDELGQCGALRTLEGLQLAVLEINDVRAHLVEERREVRCADDAA